MFAKCGIIKEDEDRQPRVKIYRDKGSGFAKGDGLVTYLKEPSVRALPCLALASAGLVTGSALDLATGCAHLLVCSRD